MKYLILNLCILFSCLVYSQKQQTEYIFEYISSQEGLSHNYVSKVVSDSLNVKWIATENGINKYDGSRFSSIQPSKKYPELESENIETLFVDSKNNLWIGTKSGGVSRLNINEHQLKSFNSLLSPNAKITFRILAIQEDELGNIWIGTNDRGLYVIDPENEKIIRHVKSSYGLRFIFKDSNNNIWYPESYNLKMYDPKTQKTESYYLKEYISAIVEDTENNCLWIGSINYTEKNHVIKFDLKTKKNTKIYTGIPSSFTSTLYLDYNNNLWLGTWGKGLYKKSNDNKFSKINLVYPPDLKKNINYEIVLDIHEDKNGVIWISSDFGGIVKLTRNFGFVNLDQVSKNETLALGMNFHSFFQDEKNIYLGTLRNGAFWGKDLSSLKQHPTIDEGKVYSIGKHRDALLIATLSDVHLLDNRQKLITKLPIQKATNFYTFDKNTLWVGTQQNGLYVIDMSDLKSPTITRNYRVKNEKHTIQSNRITGTVEDSNENIWLGTYNGLYIYNRITEQFTPHSELLDEELPRIINTVYADLEYLWLGTHNGLYKLSYKDQKLKIVAKYNSPNNGLENDFICGIREDNNGRLWLTTSTSLICFDKFSESFLNFNTKNGVYTSLFNLRTLYSNNSNTRIYAAGSDNLTFFNPDEINIDKTQNQLIFNSVKVDHKLIEANDSLFGNVFIKKDISYISSLDLPYQAKALSIGFSNTNFSNTPITNYRYKLEGMDKNWVSVKKQKEISFVGLQAGRYKLLVSATTDNKNWTIPISLKINVQHAPWSSPWAYTGYFLLVFIILGSFLYAILKQYHLKDTLLQEQELSESKFTFFTNISHEFRTPLTLILSPLKELIGKKEVDPEITEKLVVMEKNADRLLNLINQLLDFRKAENGLLQLNARRGDIVQFSEEVYLYFKEQAKLKNIDYIFSTSKENIEVSFDRNKMEIVLCNLISNALKYSKEGDQIELSLDIKDQYYIIKLRDTGIGMSKDATKKIFDRFYQIKSTNTVNIIGSGIGLSFTQKLVELHEGTIEVDSKLNNGTTFIIEIPIQLSTKHRFDESNDPIDSEKHKITEALLNEHKDLNINTKENTILVIDDNDDIRNYLKQLLKTEYNIIVAKDGVEGVDVATSEVPDLILCDIMMPRKDGLQVSKEIKSQITTSHIPVILLTARSSNMYEIQGLQTGADDFLTKPFDPKIIKARISSALQNRKKLREHFLNKVRFQPTNKETTNQNPEDTFITKAITLVEENLSNEKFDIKMMQDQLFMSQSSLYRKIKSLTGLSLTGFIRSIRLKKAAELILTTDNKFNSIALMVGFNDYKYFRQCFKKQFGCLPSEYKEQKENS